MLCPLRLVARSIPSRRAGAACPPYRQVCGLKWSPDNQYLASGGNDNKLYVWSQHSTTPVQTYTEHIAAVKGTAALREGRKDGRADRTGATDRAGWGVDLVAPSITLV